LKSSNHLYNIENNLEAKLEIMKQLDEGISLPLIAEHFNVRINFVKEVRSKKEYLSKTMNVDISKITGKSHLPSNDWAEEETLVEKTESVLITWISREKKKKTAVSNAKLRSKALAIFEFLKHEEKDYVEEEFDASFDWLTEFKKKNYIQLDDDSESEEDDDSSCEYSSDSEEDFDLNNQENGPSSFDENKKNQIKSFLTRFQDLLKEGKYSSQQIFIASEINLFWKRLPKTAIIYKDKLEVFAVEPKDSCQRVTVLLATNAVGNAKMKPMVVYKAFNPRPLKGLKKENMPVIFSSNSKARMTTNLFTEWFNSCFVPYVHNYNRENNWYNKALLIVDEATQHMISLNDLYSNIEVLFIPSSFSSFINPINQGISRLFHSFYLQQCLHDLASGNNINDIWKDFSIKQAIFNIEIAWNKVECKSISLAWKKIWSECPSTEGSFIKAKDIIKKNNLEILNDCKKIGFRSVAEEDIRELLYNYRDDYYVAEAELNDIKNNYFHEFYKEKKSKDNDQKKDKLLQCLEDAEQLKLCITLLEKNDEIVDTFSTVIDALMGKYRKQLEDC